MKLSEEEKRVIDRLRRREEGGRRWRWGVLLGGILCLGGAASSFSNLLHFLHEPDLTSVLILAYLLPATYLGGLLGAWLIVHTLANWNGHPQTRLLLKLLEEKTDS